MFLGGIDLNMSDYDGRTPLHLAASEGQSLMVDFFLDIAHVNSLVRDRLVIKIFGFLGKHLFSNYFCRGKVGLL